MNSLDVFFLEKFVDKTNFPQELPFDHFRFSYEPIVYLEYFFESLVPQKENYSCFPQVVIRNPEKVFIGVNVEIDPFVLIEGPVWISEGAKIKQGAYLRPFSFIGKNAVVGHSSEIKNSILCESSKAAHFNYVGDSLLGQNVNLGAGVKCANFKLNKSKVYLRYEDLKLSTDRNKMGAIIGKDVSIGCNTVLSPGALITPYTKIAPNTHVRGYV